jgi:uncharacterized protein (TIGR00730 family)
LRLRAAPFEFPEEEAMDAQENIERILHSPTYRRAYEDIDFLNRDETRPARLMLELMKPELVLQEHGVRTTVVVFGGTRILPEPQARARVAELEQLLRERPQQSEIQTALAVARRVLAKSPYYEQARELGRLISSTCQLGGPCDFVVMTGGGPGIMEGANRGAHDVGAKSVGLNVTLPREQLPNPFISPELCFQFHYFAMRKMHFLLRAKALVAFPGGYGTLDELFETLTLIQTQKMKPIPILLFGGAFWSQAIRFSFLADEGVIDREDLDLFRLVETAQQAWEAIVDFYRARGEWPMPPATTPLKGEGGGPKL